MKRILIVDDEPLILYSLEKTLRDEGIEVKTATNGAEAMEEGRRCFFDLCLLDIGLPDINGADLMIKFKELSPGSKIIVMSASCFSDEAKELIDKNAHIFIPKPFELPYVKAIVNQVLNEEEGGLHPWQGKKRADERRRIARRPVVKTVAYSVNCLDKTDFTDREATVCDISAAGMGFYTDHPVENGCVIRFNMLKDGINYGAGIVRNTIMVDNNLFRTGVEFI